MILRDYQKQLIDDLRSHLAKGSQRVVLCAPTGSGKTVVFSEMVRLAGNKGTVTMVLTDRTELFKQTLASLGRIGVAVEEIEPSRREIYPDATIYLGMVETVKRRKELPIKPALIILDEAHKGSFNAILDRWPDAKVIGATASPQGKHFYDYYQSIVQSVDIPDLITDGYLVDCWAHQMQDDFGDLETKRGEFTEESLFSHFDKPKLYGGVVEQWQNLAPGSKTICFNVNIEHTVKTWETFRDFGISCEYITSKTSDYDRARILAAFARGDFQVLHNCGILTTGYDESTIQTVIMNRATQSLPLALQIPGRGSRPWMGCINGLETATSRLSAISNSPKPYFTYLDFGMNHDRHGLWNESRNWQIKPPKKGSDKEKVAPVKECGNSSCGCLVAASARKCKFCGYEFPISEQELAEGVMVEVGPRAPQHLIGKRISELDIGSLLELEKSKKYKPTFLWRVLRSRGEESLKEWAKLKGYTSGWLYRQKQEIEKNEFTDYIIR